MSTIAILIAAGAAASAIALYVRLQSRRGRGTPPPPARRQRLVGEPARTAKFACVEIKPGPDACAGAQGLVGQALLATEAPALPLKECDRPCRCAFIKRPDRRQGTRRWSDEGIAATLYAAAERRIRGDRRRS